MPTPPNLLMICVDDLAPLLGCYGHDEMHTPTSTDWPRGASASRTPIVKSPSAAPPARRSSPASSPPATASPPTTPARMRRPPASPPSRVCSAMRATTPRAHARSSTATATTAAFGMSGSTMASRPSPGPTTLPTPSPPGQAPIRKPGPATAGRSAAAPPTRSPTSPTRHTTTAPPPLGRCNNSKHILEKTRPPSSSASARSRFTSPSPLPKSIGTSTTPNRYLSPTTSTPRPACPMPRSPTTASCVITRISLKPAPSTTPPLDTSSTATAPGSPTSTHRWARSSTLSTAPAWLKIPSSSSGSTTAGPSATRGSGAKHTLRETSLHVPLLLSGPGLPAHTTVRQPVANLDLFPTLCDLLHLPPPDHLDGRSILPLIHDPDRVDPDARVFSRHEAGDSIRTPRYRYSQWTRPAEGGGGVYARTLFDLTTDPGELNNLADDPAHAATVQSLAALL